MNKQKRSGRVDRKENRELSRKEKKKKNYYSRSNGERKKRTS